MSNNFGVNDTLEYHEIQFDSLDNSGRFQTRYSALDWPKFRLELPLNDITAIKVLEVQIPFSYYVINSLNNTFTLTESTGPSTTVTLPEGNYNSVTLIAALGAALTTASSNTYTYTVTYLPASGKMTITSNAGSVFTLGFGSTTDDGSTNPRLHIGFTAGDTVSNGSGVLITPNGIQITGPNYMYLNSRSIGVDCSFYLPDGAVNLTPGGAGPQMCKIPINCLPNSTIFWQDPDPQKWFDVEKNNLPQLDFYFTLGNNNTPIAFNGLSFSLKIGVLKNVKDDSSKQLVGDNATGRMTITTTNPRKRRK